MVNASRRERPDRDRVVAGSGNGVASWAELTLVGNTLDS